MSKTKPDTKTASFEESLKRLEQAVEQLQDGELTLEEAIARYEEGIKLARTLTQRLEQAQKKVERLMVEGNTVTTDDFEMGND